MGVPLLKIVVQSAEAERPLVKAEAEMQHSCLT